MKPAEKALWFIESNLTGPISIGAIANASGVSPFHLARAFSTGFGISPMRYARRRRLTEAAKALVSRDVRIIEVALDAGYGSHEAFSRAFATEFNLTPENYRKQASLSGADLQEAIAMKSNASIQLNPPQVVDYGPIRLIGLNKRYSDETSAGIPNQWEVFSKLGLEHDADVSGDTFGVLHNADEDGNVDYFCGLEVLSYSDTPDGAGRLTVPAQTYAVFSYSGHVSEIRKVWRAIWNDWVPQSGLKPMQGPELERYGKAFNPATGHGGFEIWVPVDR